ncbi:hypothetical protein [Embleya sp. NPDC059237]|uniref:hypothetical protein n=1 Tax=Embleya sp. NPDC059237 TaxID=3346784 RepID=UPI003674AFDB
MVDQAADGDKAKEEADKRMERWIGAGADGISAGGTFAAAAKLVRNPELAPVIALATVGLNGIVGEFFQANPADASDRAREEVHDVFVRGSSGCSDHRGEPRP